jgi:hypothetical protein
MHKELFDAKELFDDKALNRRARPESPLARRKNCCHIRFSKTISLSHSGLLGVRRFARLCLRYFSFDHLDDAWGRFVGESQPLRFDD